MNIKKTALSALLSLVLTAIPFQGKSISETTAKIGAIVTGVAVGGGTGALIYYNMLPATMSPKGKIAIFTLASALAGSLSWYAAYNILHSMTPQGKLVAAQRLIQLVELDALISQKFTSLDSFISHANVAFGTSWPLVLTRNYLIRCSNHLLESRNLLNSSYQEASQDPLLDTICNEVKKLQEKLSYLEKTIEEKMNIITQTYDYKEQVKFYERHLEEERKRQHASWEKSMDRWHDSHEKSKDRELKKEALQRAQNARINVTI